MPDNMTTSSYTTTYSPPPTGAWVTYGLDDSAFMSTAVFLTEVEALRYALANYQQVVFVPFGQSLREATKPAS